LNFLGGGLLSLQSRTLIYGITNFTLATSNVVPATRWTAKLGSRRIIYIPYCKLVCKELSFDVEGYGRFEAFPQRFP
jgi:hypothetical protein